MIGFGYDASVTLMGAVSLLVMFCGSGMTSAYMDIPGATFLRSSLAGLSPLSSESRKRMMASGYALVNFSKVYCSEMVVFLMMAPLMTRFSRILRLGLLVNRILPLWCDATAFVWCALSSRGATCQISALPKMCVNSLVARLLTSSLLVVATSCPMPVRSSSSSTYSDRMLARLAGIPAMDAAATFE